MVLSPYYSGAHCSLSKAYYTNSVVYPRNLRHSWKTENIRPRMLRVISMFLFEVSDTLVWLLHDALVWLLHDALVWLRHDALVGLRHDAKIILVDPFIGLLI